MEEGYLKDDAEGDEDSIENSLGVSLDHRLISKNTEALIRKYWGIKADKNGWPCSTETPNCRLSFCSERF